MESEEASANLSDFFRPAQKTEGGFERLSRAQTRMPRRKVDAKQTNIVIEMTRSVVR